MMMMMMMMMLMLMLQTLNLILLTASELSELRTSLKDSFAFGPDAKTKDAREVRVCLVLHSSLFSQSSAFM
jgi:hypothetical protein